MMRLLRRFLLTAAVVAGIGWLSLGDVEPALAYHPYHYAREYTAYASGLYGHSDIPCCLPQEYEGWAGVNGQITSPTHTPRLNSYQFDHANGFIDVNFSQGVGFLSVGWFVGTFGGGGQFVSATTPNKYIEIQLLNGTYVADVVGGPLAPGEAVIYRINRAPEPNCWKVYVYYNQFVDYVCGLANSGAPQATSEVYQVTAGPGNEMAQSNWGWSNPNTNNALRLNGSAGWEPWDTTLIARTTAHYDERDLIPAYRISAYNQWYYFTAYGGVS
jgi:hypothetical protein